MEGTDNRVIFASGTAFPSYTVASTGEVRIPGQGNNMYIFPGLGKGSILAKATHISDRMIYEASKALADSLTPEELSQGWLYPSLVRIREVSVIVAAAVIEQALKEGASQQEELKQLSYQELLEYVSSNMWSPTQEVYGASRI
jgi:malic enzyme